MNTPRRQSLRWLARQRKRGQSIPIIALMIVILIAMVGLSVDVGNTFSEEREVVSASNAASIAGMSAYVGRAAGTTDQSIYDAIITSLQSNGITPGDGTNGTVNVSAYYLDSTGEVLADHPVVGSGGEAPNNVGFIQVTVDAKVDTSFARVVGRNDLPINATAHAGLCPVNSGLYPLAIDSATIGNGAFNDTGISAADKAQEYIELADGTIQRRIYVKDDGTAGSFSWLRWMEDRGANGMAATSAPELAASMTGDGNIAWGFEEASWPAGRSMPEGYPTEPGTVNIGDWIWGSPGWSNSASLDAAIDEHIFRKTFMILPIYDEVLGQGSNTQIHVADLGSFVIMGEGREPTKGPYFDMVYLGEPVRQYTACSVTPPPPEDAHTLELFGNISFYPEYEIRPTERQPIQYVVVLDASGSMSANFNGQCNNSGGVKQCANGPAGYPDVQVTGTGPTYYWTTQNQRRIYVAKKALERLVRLSNMPGNAGYSTAGPDDKMAVVWFNESVPAGNASAFSSNPTNIINYITTLNNGNGNYRSQGGTNGAAGLYRASLLYNAAPKTVSFNGRNVEYKRVVLFITDGVSNQFLDTSASNLHGGQSTSNTYAANTYCRNLGTNVIESASCQTTDVGGMYGSKDRPITQMIKTSQQYLRNTSVNAEVFVIALSNIPSTGLRDGVPSSTNYYFAAEGLETYAGGTTNVDVIIDTINTRVELGDCIAGPSGATSGAITSGEFVDGTNGFTYPQVGEVIISNATESRVAPIKANTDGTLSYHFTGVPQGTYRMEAYLFYHHPLDPAGVMRMYSRIWSAGQAIENFTVNVSPSTQGTSFVQRVEQPLTLKLTGDVCPSP